MRTLALLLLAALPAFAAPIPKELKQNELQKIVGLWIHTGTNNSNNPAPPDGSQWKFEADGNNKGKATIIRKPGDDAGGIKFAIDPETKHFDWICPWGEWHGVYTLDGDLFAIYITGKGQNKLRNVQTGPGPGIEIYSFKRSTAK